MWNHKYCLLSVPMKYKYWLYTTHDAAQISKISMVTAATSDMMLTSANNSALS